MTNDLYKLSMFGIILYYMYIEYNILISILCYSILLILYHYDKTRDILLSISSKIPLQFKTLLKSSRFPCNIVIYLPLQIMIQIPICNWIPINFCTIFIIHMDKCPEIKFQLDINIPIIKRITKHFPMIIPINIPIQIMYRVPERVISNINFDLLYT